jgi:outer membrane protein
MMHARFARGAAALCLLVLADAAAAAQAPPGAPGSAGRPMGPPTGWQTQLGIGAIVNPEYVGADDYQVIPIPYFEFRYLDERGTRLFANVPQGIGGYFLRRRAADGRAFNLGAAIAPGFNVRGDELEGLEEVDPAVEARLLLEANTRRWGFQATLAQDVGTGHEGAYLDLSFSRRGRLGRRGGFWAVGPSLRVGDGDYLGTLFSVSPAEALASGFAPYEAEGGLERVGLQGIVSRPVGRGPWRWTAIARVSRLLGDAADSPIVAQENQLFFLTALTRRF